MGAALQQNMGREWGFLVCKQMAEASPNKVFKDIADCSEKTVVNNRKRIKPKKVDDKANICGLMTQMQLAGLIVDMMKVSYLIKLQMTSHRNI